MSNDHLMAHGIVHNAWSPIGVGGWVLSSLVLWESCLEPSRPLYACPTSPATGNRDGIRVCLRYAGMNY